MRRVSYVLYLFHVLNRMRWSSTSAAVTSVASAAVSAAAADVSAAAVSAAAASKRPTGVTADDRPSLLSPLPSLGVGESSLLDDAGLSVERDSHERQLLLICEARREVCHTERH